MKCRQSRDRLLRIAAGEKVSWPSTHLNGCEACTRFSEQLDFLRQDLRNQKVFEPDEHFAARVVARLPKGPELMGMAALRLLPASLALAVVLTGWCFFQTPTPTTLLAERPSDDPISWLLDQQEIQP